MTYSYSYLEASPSSIIYDFYSNNDDPYYYAQYDYDCRHMGNDIFTCTPHHYMSADEAAAWGFLADIVVFALTGIIIA